MRHNNTLVRACLSVGSLSSATLGSALFRVYSEIHGAHRLYV